MAIQIGEQYKLGREGGGESGSYSTHFLEAVAIAKWIIIQNLPQFSLQCSNGYPTELSIFFTRIKPVLARMISLTMSTFFVHRNSYKGASKFPLNVQITLWSE